MARVPRVQDGMAAQGAPGAATQMGFLRRTVDPVVVIATFIRCFSPAMFRDIANDAADAVKLEGPSAEAESLAAAERIRSRTPRATWCAMVVVQGLLLAFMAQQMQGDTQVSLHGDTSALWEEAATHLPDDFQVAMGHNGHLSLQGEGVRSGYSLWYEQELTDIMADQAMSVLTMSERLEFELDESMDATDREREHLRFVGLATSRCHAFEEALRRGQRKVKLAVWVDREGPVRLSDMVKHRAPFVFTATHACHADCEAAAALDGEDVDTERGILRSMPVSCDDFTSMGEGLMLDKEEFTALMLALASGELHEAAEAFAEETGDDLGLDDPSVDGMTPVVRREMQRPLVASVTSMMLQAAVRTAVLSVVVLMFAVCKPEAKIAGEGLFEAVVMAQTVESTLTTALGHFLHYCYHLWTVSGTAGAGSAMSPITRLITGLFLTWGDLKTFAIAVPVTGLFVSCVVIPLAVIHFHETALVERKRIVALPAPAAPQEATREPVPAQIPAETAAGPGEATHAHQE